MYRLAFALLSLVALSASLGSCAVCGKKEFWSLVVSLDNYSSGSTDEVPSFELLREAYEQFNGCHKLDKIQLMDSEPRVALLNDFLVKPMERFLEAQHLSDRDAKKAFATRLAKYYAQFRPIYMGDDKAVDSYIRCPKTAALISSLAKLTGHEPLTVKMLVDAKKEYDVLSAKVQEIVNHEDVYAEARDLSLYMKYLIRGPTRALDDYVFPHVSKNMNLNAQLTQELRNQFKKGLKERGYRAYDDAVYRLK